MLLVATLAKTADQAGSWQAIVAVVMGALGGAFFPIAQAGRGLALLSYLTPHGWFMRGLADLAGGGGVGAVWQPAAAMLVFAAIGGGLAVLRSPKLVRP
jgi:ABC-2 type transport system permease protein